MFRNLLADSFRWTSGAAPPRHEVVAAALGLAGPIALAAAIGRLPLGMAAAIGALAPSRGGEGTLRQRTLGMAGSAVFGAVAIAAGSAIATLGGFALFLIPVLAAVAALLGGINRPIGLIAAQFILVTIIGSGIGDAAARPIGRGQMKTAEWAVPRR